MYRNGCGYWMSPKFFMHFAADSGAGTGGDAGSAGESADGGASEGASDGAEGAGNGADGEQVGESTPDSRDAEIARLKAEMAKQKNALDNATKEAGNLRKELRSKMTQEQLDAENKKEAEEAQKNRILELEKQVAKSSTVKGIMGKLGMDEESAGTLADALYGADDVDNVLLLIQKAWQARESALRKEFGKVTGPGAGADSNSPEAQAIKRAAEFGKARNAQNEQAQKAMQAYMR